MDGKYGLAVFLAPIERKPKFMMLPTAMCWLFPAIFFLAWSCCLFKEIRDGWKISEKKGINLLFLVFTLSSGSLMLWLGILTTQAK